jgi:hypothetical protein
MERAVGGFSTKYAINKFVPARRILDGMMAEFRNVAKILASGTLG